ncbi:hypothetical protein AAFC00_006961 [Neodothiora populina]
MSGSPLLFRNVALLYPWKDVLERIRRHGNEDTTLPLSIPPMFDEDEDRDSPFAAGERIRVIIAQDDTGVSLNRLLFDSDAQFQRSAQDSVRASISTSPASQNNKPRGTASTPANRFRGISAQSEISHSNGSDTTLSPVRTQKGHHATMSQVSSSQESIFGQRSGALRRPSHNVSLADARIESQLPIEESKEEMDSCLDCVFGKGQMRYKGENTKLHFLQRQAHITSPGVHGPEATSTSSEHIKTALLVSRTFVVPMQDQESVPAKPTASRELESDRSGTKPSANSRYTTPTFAVAVLLPLAQPRSVDLQAQPDVQPVLNHWRTIVRALDAFEAVAIAHIHQLLQEEVDVLPKRHLYGIPTTSNLLRLKPAALNGREPIVSAAVSTSERISRAFHVVPALPRDEWNIWRDELRDITRSGKGSDNARINFIQVAMTAALTSQSTWIGLFAPIHLQARLQRESRRSTGAQNRVVIMSADDNRARQIVYVLSRFFTRPSPSSSQFVRSPNLSRGQHVSALTQGLRAVGQRLGDVEVEQVSMRAARMILDPPSFNIPFAPPTSTSPVKSVNGSLAAPQNGTSIQRMKSRIDVGGKCTPAMPIASAPSSSYTTPAASPDARPGSSASAQGDLLRHLQRNNSALSETSAESGSFWSSLRSTSWNWGIRRGSGATNASSSDGGAGNSLSLRGDPHTGILKTAKTSFSRSSGKKLVRMVEEASQLRVPCSDAADRKDSGVPTPTAHVPATMRRDPAALPQTLGYTYDAENSIVDVHVLGDGPSRRTSFEVPRTGASLFPLASDKQVSQSNVHVGAVSDDADHDSVAGCLEQLHPDYALQALKPYAKIEEDIKLAMQGERSPWPDFSSTDPRSFPLECWVDVCSTVVIDADTQTVRRITLHRNLRYSLLSRDQDLPHPASGAAINAIKVTRSDEMDTVKRTYRRDDAGSKVDWKDKRVVSSDPSESHDSGDRSLTSSYENFAAKVSTSSSPKKQPIAPAISVLSRQGNAQTPPTEQIGDDLTAFIDERTKPFRTKKTPPPSTTTRRVPKRNAEGKMTGWQEVDETEVADAGLNDLPTGFVDQRRGKRQPAVYGYVLEERYVEEIISKPEQTIVNITDQMLSANDTRSSAPSRASSVHERSHSRTNSRSNSICGSGLSELQLESKKIVGNALESLIASVASEAYDTCQRSGGIFGFRRAIQAAPEASILRDSISRCLAAK